MVVYKSFLSIHISFKRSANLQIFKNNATANSKTHLTDRTATRVITRTTSDTEYFRIVLT
jgi:hypothetical protein